MSERKTWRCFELVLCDSEQKYFCRCLHKSNDNAVSNPTMILMVRSNSCIYQTQKANLQTFLVMCFLRCAQAEFNNGCSIFVLSEIDFLCKISATSVQRNMSKPFSKVLKWFGKPFRGIQPPSDLPHRRLTCPTAV